MRFGPVTVLEDLDADDDVVQTITWEGREITSDETVVSLGESPPELRDGFAGNVEADEVQPSPDQWDVVPTVATAHVEPFNRKPADRVNLPQDVVDERDRGFFLIPTASVFAVPRRFNAHGQTTLREGGHVDTLCRRCRPSR